VRNREEVEVGVTHQPEEWKKIDILINNAGLGQGIRKNVLWMILILGRK
jgi:3-hydroxy acid dehydrogenase/malonic semialdehyde reductase